MNTKLLAILLVTLSFCSCGDKAAKTIDGWWSIDSVNYNSQDMRFFFGVNSISFSPDGSCETPPRMEDLAPGIEQKLSSWVLFRSNENHLFLKIHSDDELFSREYRVIFKKDEANKLLKMELLSDSLHIVARKGLFDYDRNISLINKLVRESN